MGSVASKCYSRCRRSEKTRKLKAKIRLLEEEADELRRARAEEVWSHERSLSVFSSTEERWRTERKRHKEEAARLKRQLAEAEDRAWRLEEEKEAAASRGDKEWRRLDADYLVEQMAEEQARREEAVEKWKQLYLAIKTELDDLIHRTSWQGERIFWGSEEVMIEKLQKELKAKDETMETLRTRIAVMEKEGARRDREIDILRQSLRILSNKKRNRVRPRGLRERGMQINVQMESEQRNWRNNSIIIRNL